MMPAISTAARSTPASTPPKHLPIIGIQSHVHFAPLRVINAAAATVFWIETGEAQARLVAVDGHAVQPVPGTRFGLAMGQRLDLEIDLPQEGGACPIIDML